MRPHPGAVVHPGFAAAAKRSSHSRPHLFAYGTQTFAAPGTYTITLTVRDASGQTATLAKTVTVRAI